MRRLFLTCIAAATVAVAVVPAAADAASVNVQNGHLQFNAAAGETNAVTLSANSDLIVVSDANALITPGPGCFTGAPSHKVSCSPPSLLRLFQVELGDRSDKLTVAPSMPLGVLAHGQEGDDVLRGGAYDDQLFGGAGNDSADGGAGSDRLVGGDGTDTADYSSRTNPVFVQLGSDGDGEDGELDLVEGDVENVIGGAGNDELTGNDAPNVLSGRGGDDALQGRKGSDTLDGGGGRNMADYNEHTTPVTVTLDGVANDGSPGENDKLLRIDSVQGGSGKNTLIGNGNANVLLGGNDADTIRGLGGSDFVIGSGGVDTLDSGGGADFVDAQDGFADHITCDALDTLKVDAIDIKTGC